MLINILQCTVQSLAPPPHPTPFPNPRNYPVQNVNIVQKLRNSGFHMVIRKMFAKSNALEILDAMLSTLYYLSFRKTFRFAFTDGNELTIVATCDMLVKWLGF